MVKENRLVDNLLNTLYERNTFTCDIKTKANPDETNSACWYGLSKIHEILIDGLKKNKQTKKKQIGSPTSKIEKCFLDYVSLPSKNEYTFEDLFEVRSMIEKRHYDIFMCSFDIDYFTDVRLEETIGTVNKNVLEIKNNKWVK